MIPSSFFDELEKIAISRYEKEIRKGTIQRSDVVPGASNVTGGIIGAPARKAARNVLQAAPEVAPEQLARNRALSGMLYKQQAKTPPKGISVHQKFVPGVGPATAGAGLSETAKVFVPPEAGQWSRTIARPLGMPRAVAATIPNIPRFIAEPHPSDPSLTHGILRHEFGEAQTLGQPAAPFSSHLGPRPILEEQMSMRGDPEALHSMGQIRKIHPEDEMVQKHIKQMGGLPGRPLPIGGKHERKLTSMVSRSPEKLSPATRARALQFHMMGGQNVPMVPKEIPEQLLRAVGEHIPNLLKAVKTKDFRSIPGHLKSVVEHLKPALNFVKKGK